MADPGFPRGGAIIFAENCMKMKTKIGLVGVCPRSATVMSVTNCQEIKILLYIPGYAM